MRRRHQSSFFLFLLAGAVCFFLIAIFLHPRNKLPRPGSHDLWLRNKQILNHPKYTLKRDNLLEHIIHAARKRSAPLKDVKSRITMQLQHSSIAKCENTQQVLHPVFDPRPNSVKSPVQFAACFVLATVLDTGGIESWFWELFENVFNVFPFTVHAVQVRSVDLTVMIVALFIQNFS